MGWAGAAALAALAVWLIVTVPGLGYKYAYEWDSVQLALGAKEWKLSMHQPHPFGFPFWVLMMKALQPVMDPLLSQRVLSLLFTIAGLWVLYLLVKEAAGETAALVATALVAWGPPVRMLAVAQSTYPVDFFGGGLAGWLGMKAWRGDARSAFLLPVVVALLGGVRSSTLNFLALFVAAALCVFLMRTRRWGVAASGVAVAAAVTAAWVVAVVRNAGGVGPLKKLADGTFGESLKLSSVFHGAPWWATVKMMELTSVWIGLAVLGLLAPLAVWLLLSRMWRPVGGSRPSNASDPLTKPIFYVLWAGPTLAAIYFVHGPKPGYQMLALPAVALLATTLVWRAARRVTERKQNFALATLAIGLFSAVGVTQLPYGHLQVRHEYWFEVFRAMPQVHQDIDESMAALFRLVDEGGEESVLVLYRSTFESPNLRTLGYYRPDMPQAGARTKGFEVIEGFDVLEHGAWRQAETLPDWVKNALIVIQGFDPDWQLRAKYPLMRRVYKGPFMQVWRAPYR